MRKRLRPNPKNNLASRVFFAAVCFLLAVQTVSAQDDKVILPTREVTTRKAFDEITKQTAYGFVVNWNDLKHDKKTVLASNALSVKELLEQVLSGTGYIYEIRGRQIFFKPAGVSGEQTDGGQEMLRSGVSVLPSRPVRGVFDDAGFDYSRLKYVKDPYSENSESGTGKRVGINGNPGSWTVEDNMSVEIITINFRVGKSLLEYNFMNNARALDIIDKTFSNMELISKMDYVTITSASSPEGGTSFNEQLAKDRALSVKSYIMWKHPHIDRERILTYSIGEDWTGLRKMVEEDLKVPGRGEVLELLSGDMDNDVRKTRLKKAANGNAYEYIARNMLPYLRGAAACMIYFKPDTDKPAGTAADTVTVERVVERFVRDTVFVDKIVEAAPAAVRKTRYFALKTNLLYDLALLPDFGVEFSLGKRWSLELQGQWSWWKFNDRHYYHRIQMGGIEVRKWLGDRSKTPLTGHFIGVYGYGGTYDVRFGDNGCLSDRSISAGITYGYSTPLGRRLNMEFSLGVGYFGGEYKKYKFDRDHDRYPWQSDNKLNYVGPTKAEIALVWLIGTGTNNKKSK